MYINVKEMGTHMRFLLCLALGLLLTVPAYTAPTKSTALPSTKARSIHMRPTVLSLKKLRALRIRPYALRLSNISEDGRVTVCTEKERDIRLVAKGQVWKLRVFTMGTGASRPTLSTVLLPTTALQQVWISPDGTQALVVSDEGTRLTGVDLKTGRTHVVFTLEKGAPSFRVQPPVVWFEKGSFHTLGYFMDEKQVSKGDAVVSVDVHGSGLSAIHKVRDITELLKDTRGGFVSLWHSSDQAYFAGKFASKKMVLGAYYGQAQTPVDVAQVFAGMAASDNRVVYMARYAPYKSNLIVCDVPQKKKWLLGDGTTEYNYPYISTDGKTVLASTFDLKKGLMSTYYARESDRFKLHAFPGLEKLPMSPMRFSGDGRTLVLYNTKGLQWYRVPQASPQKKG